MKIIFISKETQASLDEDIENAILRWSGLFNIEQALIRAIIKKESTNYPFAYRVDHSVLKRQSWYSKTLDNFEKTEKKFWASYGLMQVLYGVAKKDYKFRGNPYAMLDPDVSVQYGCRLLKDLKRYPDIKDRIAYFNGGGWAVRKKNREGKYPNKTYVDKVYKYYKQFGGVGSLVELK